MHQEVFDGDDDDDDDEMIGQFSGTSDWWTVGTLLIIAVSLQPPHCQPFLKSIVTCHALVFVCMTSRWCSVEGFWSKNAVSNLCEPFFFNFTFLWCLCQYVIFDPLEP